MLTQRTAQGVSAMLLANILGRVAGLAAQIVTGFVLLNEEFGAFAMAIGVMTVSGLLRGGEIQNYLVSLPPARRRFRTGSAFWLSEGFYLLGVIPVLILTPWISRYLEQPGLPVLIWILSASVLLAPVRFVLRARLNAELRFELNARGTLLNTLVQYPLMIVLALILENAVALCIPVFVGVAAELVYLFAKARPSKYDFIPSRRILPKLLHQIRWLLAVAAMTSLWASGDYFIAEFFVPAAILGTYYFGYQLAVQPGRLFMVTVTSILVPVVRRVGDDQARLQSVIRRLIGTGGFAIAMVNLSMLAGIRPLEAFIWNEKWVDSVFAVQVLSIGLTFTAILGIATTPLLAARRYVESLIVNGVRALAVLLGAGTGAAVWGTVDGIAMMVSLCMGLSGIGATTWLGSRYGLTVTHVVPHLLRCTAPVILAGIIAAFVGNITIDSMDSGRAGALVAGIVAGGCYAFLLLIALRLLPSDTSREIVSLTPARLRGLVAKFAGQPRSTQDS